MRCCLSASKEPCTRRCLLRSCTLRRCLLRPSTWLMEKGALGGHGGIFAPGHGRLLKYCDEGYVATSYESITAFSC